MAYMDSSTAFAPKIHELRLNEIDEVAGGIPFVVAAALTFYGAEIAYGAGFVAGAAVATYAYVNG